MAQIISEFIISIDGCARGTRSPAYYGFHGEEFEKWLGSKSDEPHRNVLGRKTYELFTSLPETVRDDDYQKMAATSGWLYSRTLNTTEWPGLEVIDQDVSEHLRQMKQDDGPEIRVVGSLSLMRQLVKSGTLDLLRLIVCPLALPQSGIEPLFEGMDDVQFSLKNTKTLDGRILVIDYAPNGAPPVA